MGSQRVGHNWAPLTSLQVLTNIYSHITNSTLENSVTAPKSPVLPCNQLSPAFLWATIDLFFSPKTLPSAEAVYVESRGMQSFASCSLHLAPCIWDSSMLLHVLTVWSFLFLSGIHCMVIIHVVTHYPVQGHLGCFSLRQLWNSVALKFSV